MSKERDLWTTTSANLSPFGKLVRIESSLGPGIPDVAYILKRPGRDAVPASGWVELKKLDAFPARPGTTITLPKLEIEQVQFAEDWAAAGGRAYLLLRAPPWYLLFDPEGIRRLFRGEVVAKTARLVAVASGFRTFPTGPILRALTDERRI